METCKIVFESVNEYGQIERHVHYTTDYNEALKAETKLQRDIQAAEEKAYYEGRFDKCYYL